MAAGEAFVIEDTAADTNVSHTTESDRGLAGSPLLQQGDWSGQWSSPELTIPTGTVSQPFLFGFSQELRSSGTTRSGALCQFSLNTGGGHVNQGIQAVTTWGYNRLSGGHDESTHHGCWMEHLDAGDLIKVRQGTQLNTSDRVGDYNRTSGDPRGLWAVQLPDNDYLYAEITGTDVGSGVYQNTPRPIDLGTPSALSSGSWKIITWDSTVASSGSTITRSGSTFTVAANSKVLIDFHSQWIGSTDRNSALVQFYKNGSPYAYVSIYHRGSGYNDRSTAVATFPIVTGGTAETFEVYFVDQVEEASGGEMDCIDAAIRFIDLTGADMCILGKTDADITNMDNTWRDATFPTADEIVDDTSFDHNGTNPERINNNAGATITVLSGGIALWDKSTGNSTRVEPGHRLARSGTGLDYAIWSQYVRGAQSGDDQFIGGSSFCAPATLTSAQYLTLQYQDIAQQGGGDGMVLNATDGAAILFWAIRIDDLGGSGPVNVNVPAATLSLTGYAPTVVGVAPKNIDVPLGTLTLTGYAPTVVASDHKTVDVPLGTLTLTGYAPTVVTSDHKTVNVPLGTLTLTGYAPTVVGISNEVVDVPLGTLTLTGYAPTVVTSDHKTVDVPLGTLTLTGYAPAILTGGPVEAIVPLGVLILIGYAPEIEISYIQSRGGKAPRKKEPEPFPVRDSSLYDRAKPPLASLQAQREKQLREEMIRQKAEIEQKNLEEYAIRQSVAARMEAERAEFEAKQRRKKTALINLEKAKKAKAEKAAREAEINKVRLKNLRKARRAKAKKRRK